jgi:uncharacterized protein
MPRDGAPCAPDLIGAARPRSPHVHLAGDLALLSETARIYRLDPAQVAWLSDALLAGDAVPELARLGLAAPDPAPPPETPERPVRALALTVAQTCNLACVYCYAAGGNFGGPDTRMSWQVARDAIDALITGTPPGGSVKIAFMGGEPAVARDLIRRSVLHARRRAAARAVTLGFSVTTNATLLTEADADFLAEHRFAVTVSLDGGRAANDRLRPARGGAGSFDRVAARLGPLLARRDRIALSARVTATPDNLDLPATMAALGGLGFASVGVSPMITSPTGQGALAPDDYARLLAAMVRCGEDWLAATLDGRAHPFANLATALQELHRGQPRSHACGAARDYLAVDAAGAYSACHRFVNDPAGQLGSLGDGIDHGARRAWLAARSVETQVPCATCWARRLCGGGCHHEVVHAGRPACDYVRGWLHFAMTVYGRLLEARPDWFDGPG